MTIVDITDTFSVSGELNEQDIAALKEKGISMLINLRPDNESADQVNNNQWQVLCEKHGLNYQHIPVLPCQYSDQDIESFESHLADSDVKVHSFCKTGTRAVHMWALSNRETHEFIELQAKVTNKGYDLKMISGHFE